MPGKWPAPTTATTLLCLHRAAPVTAYAWETWCSLSQTQVLQHEAVSNDINTQALEDRQTLTAPFEAAWMYSKLACENLCISV